MRIERALKCVMGGALMAMGAVVSAFAQQGVTKLADTGYWAAGAYRINALDAPALCVLNSGTQPNGLFVGFRVEMNPDGSSQKREIRFIDDRWELPPNLDGSPYQMTLGTFKIILHVDTNDNHTVGSYLDVPTLQSMLAAMDTASAAAVTMGSSRPLAFSLIQSRVPTNAFRTCAHIPGITPDSSASPFGSP